METFLTAYEKILTVLRGKISNDLKKIYANGHVIENFDIDRFSLTIGAKCVKCGKKQVFCTDLITGEPFSMGFLSENKCEGEK